MHGRFVAVRGRRVSSSARRGAGWLIGEDAADSRRHYYWSNFGPATPLDRHDYALKSGCRVVG